MNSITVKYNEQFEQGTDALLEDIEQFYDEATEDYSFWSSKLNMHFGYCRMGKTIPFLRETMLSQMNEEIYDRLQVLPKQNILDFGCGMGGTMRHFLKRDKTLSLLGLTISEFQVKEGNRLLEGLNGKIQQQNFLSSSVKSESMDKAYAIESFCHVGHSEKAFQEAYRVLKPKGCFVLADALLKKSVDELCAGSHFCYEQLCKGWSLSGLGSKLRSCATFRTCRVQKYSSRRCKFSSCS